MLILFLGENAQGKTNLLEAIYISSMGKSFRNSNDKKDLVKFDADMCRINTYYKKFDEDKSVEIAINNAGKKYIKVDGLVAKRFRN